MREAPVEGFQKGLHKSSVHQHGIISSSLFSVGSSLKLVGNKAGRGLFSAVTAGYDHLTTAHLDKENVVFVKFSKLEWRDAAGVQQQAVLLLGYETGFQVWDLQNCTQIQELVSKRDGPVSFLEPLPCSHKPYTSSSPLYNATPALAIVSLTALQTASSLLTDTDSGHTVQLYSMQSHTYVHTLRFNSRVLSLKCSQRLLVVALDAQIHAFDTNTLQHTCSAVTYSVSAAMRTVKADACQVWAAAPMALGSAWLAYASNQAVSQATAQATPLSTPHPSMGPGLSPRNGHTNGNVDSLSLYAKAYARQSGQQLKVLGEAGFKYLSGAVENWRAGSAVDGNSVKMPSGGEQDAAAESLLVGTVMVRDVVNRQLVAHFRAHTSPLLALQFDPSGTLLVTASLHGHNIHIFHICPWQGTGRDQGGGSGRPLASAVHLYRLARGVTPAVIRDISFSTDGSWLGVSSARGTTHIFRLAGLSSKDDQSPHLAAAGFSRSVVQRPSANGLSAGHEPTRLTAIGRARAGGFLNGSLPGSAAAAAVVTMYNGHPGKGDIAACFRPAQGPPHRQLHPQGTSTSQVGALSEDLFVMTAGGGLVRHKHRLHTSGQSEAGTTAVDREEEGGPEGPAGAPVLLAEPQEKWDLCRHPSWPEREEMLQPSMPGGTCTPQKPPGCGGRGPDPAWMVNAETQTCAPSQIPIWADGQFSCLELLPPQSSEADDSVRSSQQAAWSKLEEVRSRRVQLGRHTATPRKNPPTIMFSAPSQVAVSARTSSATSTQGETSATSPAARFSHSASPCKPVSTASTDAGFM